MGTGAVDTATYIAMPDPIEFESRIAGSWRRAVVDVIELVIRVGLFVGFIMFLATATHVKV